MGKSKYTPELADEICHRLSSGESLRAICRSEAMPAPATVRDWVNNDVHGFSEQYARARDMGLDELAEEVLEISDTRTGGGDDIGHRKLQIETRKWFLSKLAPKRYGDRSAMEISGANGGPVQFGDTERVAKVAAMVMAAQAGKGEDEQ